MQHLREIIPKVRRQKDDRTEFFSELARIPINSKVVKELEISQRSKVLYICPYIYSDSPPII